MVPDASRRFYGLVGSPEGKYSNSRESAERSLTGSFSDKQKRFQTLVYGRTKLPLRTPSNVRVFQSLVSNTKIKWTRHNLT